jgi:hypothetical protein
MNSYQLIKKNTWLLIIIAAILGSWVYFYEIKAVQNQAVLEEKQQQIFSFTEEKIKKIIIQKPNQTLEFERTKNKSQPWQMKQPQDVSANNATISFLLDLIAKGKRDRTFSVSPSQLAQYGLEKPIAHIIIELDNQATSEIFLGNPSLNEESIYAYTPSAASKTKIALLLVSRNWQYAVDRELSEWQENVSTK